MLDFVKTQSKEEKGDCKMKIIRLDDYQQAKKSYSDVSDKYAGLEKAYNILKSMTSNGESFPYTKKIIRKVCEEARREREYIRGFAGKCQCHLRTCSCRM